MKFFYVLQTILLCVLGAVNATAETAQQQMLAIAASADANGVIKGKDGWLFLQDELEHLGVSGFFGETVIADSKASKPEFADPLPAIVDFNRQLQDRNIDLVFAVIPPKALIYSDKLPVDIDPDTVVAVEKLYTDLYKELDKQGVHVLDLIPVFRNAKAKELLYCKTDTHYSGNGLRLVADELSNIIKKSKWYAGVAKGKFTTTDRELAIHGDLAAMEKSDVREEILLSYVVDDTTGKAITPDPESPVLLLGDSHTLVFSVGGDLHSNGAGLFDQLSADLEFPIDRIGVRGSGATPSRIKLYQRSRKDARFLEHKKVIVWCLSARELTGTGGWRKIPVAKK